jgi:Mycothiol maleylpyruvate isomerase N-terminal domain
MAPRGSGSLTRWQRAAIQRIAAVRRSTLAFIAHLPEQELMRPRTQDRWSVKDVLGHLLGCDEETGRRFRLIARGRGDRIHWFHDMADADRFNARCVARARRLRLPALLRRMERAHDDLIARLERLPTTSLRDPSHQYSVVEWLPAPGWTHERDHLSEIRAWWRSQRTARDGRASGRRKAARSARR